MAIIVPNSTEKLILNTMLNMAGDKIDFTSDCILHLFKYDAGLTLDDTTLLADLSAQELSVAEYSTSDETERTIANTDWSEVIGDDGVVTTGEKSFPVVVDVDTYSLGGYYITKRNTDDDEDILMWFEAFPTAFPVSAVDGATLKIVLRLEVD